MPCDVKVTWYQTCVPSGGETRSHTFPEAGEVGDTFTITRQEKVACNEDYRYTVVNNRTEASYDEPTASQHGFLSTGQITVELINCVSTGYDCINGNCLPAGSFGTSGYFDTIAECEAICAWSCTDGKQCVDPNSFCPPGKVCLETSEYREIQRLISRISQELC